MNFLRYLKKKKVKLRAEFLSVTTTTQQKN